MDIYINEEQKENAQSPILVTLAGMTISNREPHKKNAESHIILVPSLTE